MKPRGKWQGAGVILQFNWPLYAAAAVVMALGVAGAMLANIVWLRLACALAAAGAAYFILVSLGVSYLVYDRSDLYRWGWLKRALGEGKPKGVAVCHSGFDEVSGPLAEVLRPETMTVLDHFDAGRMSEPSIRRARRLYPPAASLPAAFNAWPLAGKSQHAIFGLLAIHEFRTEAERVQWFTEARRCLAEGGRIIVAEHLRDAANFIAFGPGFLHFHSAAAWRQSWEGAGLVLVDSFRVTPWIGVFVLTAP